MFDRRTVIIGNGGSGKSTLARTLGQLHRIPVVDLDVIHWEDTRGQKRDKDLARKMTRQEAAKSRWVIEGVYGWLAEVAMPNATALIWLDLPWADCRAGLVARGPWEGVDEAGFADLLAWSEAYWTRQTSSSFAGHARLYEAFAGQKVRLRSRVDVEEFIADLKSGPTSEETCR